MKSGAFLSAGGWLQGQALRDTLQVRPCKLGRGLLVCAVLRTRQDRGWASCPTRRGMPRAHAADGPAAPAPAATIQHGRVGGCKRQKQNHSQMQDLILQPAIACSRWQLRNAVARFCLRLRARGKWKGEAGEGDGTVGAMDGAIEPPWMGLRRVPAPSPASTHTGTWARRAQQKSPGTHIPGQHAARVLPVAGERGRSPRQSTP